MFYLYGLIHYLSRSVKSSIVVEHTWLLKTFCLKNLFYWIIVNYRVTKLFMIDFLTYNVPTLTPSTGCTSLQECPQFPSHTLTCLYDRDYYFYFSPLPLLDTVIFSAITDIVLCTILYLFSSSSPVPEWLILSIIVSSLTYPSSFFSFTPVMSLLRTSYVLYFYFFY